MTTNTARTALITGGASGLGAAAAERLRADGVKVTMLDLAGADVSADVTDEAALLRLASEAGPFDILVNSAGVVGPSAPLLDTTAAQWRRVLDVNVIGTVNTLRAFVPGMREGGWGGSSTSQAWRARTATPTCPSTPRPRPRSSP